MSGKSVSDFLLICHDTIDLKRFEKFVENHYGMTVEKMDMQTRGIHWGNFALTGDEGAQEFNFTHQDKTLFRINAEDIAMASLPTKSDLSIEYAKVFFLLAWFCFAFILAFR